MKPDEDVIRCWSGAVGSLFVMILLFTKKILFSSFRVDAFLGLNGFNIFSCLISGRKNSEVLFLSRVGDCCDKTGGIFNSFSKSASHSFCCNVPQSLIHTQSPTVGLPHSGKLMKRELCRILSGWWMRCEDQVWVPGCSSCLPGVFRP